MKRRAFIGLGVTSIGVGTVHNTGAFSATTAARGVTVSAADDPNAQLGLVGIEDASTTPEFVNRSSQTLAVELDSSDASVEVDVGNTDSFESVPVSFEIAVDDGVEAPITADSEEALLDIAADLVATDGSVAGSITAQRNAAIPQAEQIQVTASVKSAGNSGKYEFELENTGSIDVTIVGLGINETTNGNAVRVDGGPDEILVDLDRGVSLVSEGIPIDSSDPENATVIGFNDGDEVTLAVTETNGFEFVRFLDGRGKNAKMKGEDVRVTLAFSDGSTSVETLCLNGCDF
ncbi:hypothetical protein [Natrinema salinisoli]|uniref:hypothetical protein n=1 Tax=Natrinema salinisoli TaxID=2878535 RepID=UPI001CF09288|nr:hypothetical protein [Natrinema salinisoli]